MDFANEELIFIETEVETEFAGDELMFITLSFYFSSFNLTLKVDSDTDEISMEWLKNTPNNHKESTNLPPILKGYLGRKIGEVWQCKNSRGYADLVILGFDGMRPSLAILAEGSCLKIYEMPAIEKRVSRN